MTGGSTRTPRQKDSRPMSFRFSKLFLAALVSASICTTAAPAQEPAAEQTGPVLGPETNLPLPRFVSIKSSKAYVRRGPSRTHRIDWEFKRKDLPVQVTAEFGHWRRIRDRDGAGGWIHYALLSGRRTVLVDKKMISLFKKPDPNSTEIARLQKGVIGHVTACIPTWCELRVEAYRGWAAKEDLWGVTPEDIFD